MTFEEVAELVADLPRVELGTSYGAPALKVRGRLLLRERPEDGLLVVPVAPGERDVLLAASPDVYSVTDHYRGADLVLVDPATVAPDELRELLVEAWRARAGAREVARFDAAE